jgi:hypothetical protein
MEKQQMSAASHSKGVINEVLEVRQSYLVVVIVQVSLKYSFEVDLLDFMEIIDVKSHLILAMLDAKKKKKRTNVLTFCLLELRTY